MAEREKGVATAPCPNCGKDLPLTTELPDGGVTTESCSKCYPAATKKEVAASAKELTRETGTDTTKES